MYESGRSATGVGPGYLGSIQQERAPKQSFSEESKVPQRSVHASLDKLDSLLSIALAEFGGLAERLDSALERTPATTESNLSAPLASCPLDSRIINASVTVAMLVEAIQDVGSRLRV